MVPVIFRASQGMGLGFLQPEIIAKGAFSCFLSLSLSDINKRFCAQSLHAEQIAKIMGHFYKIHKCHIRISQEEVDRWQI